MRKSTRDKVIAGLAGYDGKLLSSSLSTEAEEHLRQGVRAARAATAAAR